MMDLDAGVQSQQEPPDQKSRGVPASASAGFGPSEREPAAGHYNIGVMNQWLPLLPTPANAAVLTHGWSRACCLHLPCIYGERASTRTLTILLKRLGLASAAAAAVAAAGAAEEAAKEDEAKDMPRVDCMESPPSPDGMMDA
jgi:hypothetical protein